MQDTRRFQIDFSSIFYLAGMHRQTTRIEVWDPLLRSFHWLLAAAFAVAWWSQGQDIRIHLLAGSIIPGLLLFRLIWGLIGEHHALFATFRPSLPELAQQFKSLLRLQAKHYTGHTPLGSLMIYALLIALGVLGLSGMMLMALQMGLGPFAGWARDASFATQLQVAQLHHWCFHLLQGLIAVHLLGIVMESLLQRSNLIGAMITGKKTLKEINP
jgi:cytochrome b